MAVLSGGRRSRTTNEPHHPDSPLLVALFVALRRLPAASSAPRCPAGSGASMMGRAARQLRRRRRPVWRQLVVLDPNRMDPS